MQLFLEILFIVVWVAILIPAFDLLGDFDAWRGH